MNHKDRLKKMEFAIKTLKEFSLCIKHQNIDFTLEDGNIVIDLVSDEVEKFEVIK